MKLNQQTILTERAALSEKGYALPAFDRAAVAKNTAERPEWVHFGARATSSARSSPTSARSCSTRA